LLVVTKLITAELHSLYIESEAGVDVGVGNFAKVGLGVGIRHFTSDSATLIITTDDILQCGQMRKIFLMIHKRNMYKFSAINLM